MASLPSSSHPGHWFWGLDPRPVHTCSGVAFCPRTAIPNARHLTWGGLMGTSDLTPAPGRAAPSCPELRPKPGSPSCLLSLLPASRPSRSAVDGTGRMFPEAVSSRPVTTRKRGHATPPRLHTGRCPERREQCGSAALWEVGGGRAATRRRLHQGLPQTACRAQTEGTQAAFPLAS